MSLSDILIYGSLGVTALWTTGMVYLCVRKNEFSEKIDNEDDLRKIVEEETKKLGMKEPLTVEYYPLRNASHAYATKEDGKGIIGIRKGDTRATVRHELYHLHDGHCDHNSLPLPIWWARYLFYEEVKAILYQNGLIQSLKS